MKKNILFVILLVLVVFAIQAVDQKKELVFPLNETGQIVFTEVIEMPNLTKDVLYPRAYEWFAKSFVSAQNVIQMQDKENGKLVGKGAIPDINGGHWGGVMGHVNFTISIYIKDGKYKYEMTDFFHEGVCKGDKTTQNGGALETERPACGRNYITIGDWKRMKQETNIYALDLIERLKKAMTVESAGDNW